MWRNLTEPIRALILIALGPMIFFELISQGRTARIALLGLWIFWTILILALLSVERWVEGALLERIGGVWIAVYTTALPTAVVLLTRSYRHSGDLRLAFGMLGILCALLALHARQAVFSARRDNHTNERR